MNKIVIKLNPSAEKMVRKKHPWVFDTGIKQVKGKGKAGDLAIIFDNKSNKFLACGLYDPHSPIKVKVLQFLKATPIDETWFRTKIQAAYDRRKPLLSDNKTNAYRLLFGENDNFPSLIADVYSRILVLKTYSLIWFPYLKEIVNILVEITNVKVVVLRLSRNVEKLHKEHNYTNGDVLFGTLEKPNIVFKEHGVFFKANVLKGHKTGFFLDHRHNRKKVGELSKNKKVLDVFSYAGGFSVHALAGGAKEVVSVDISPKALELAEENAQLNKSRGKYTTIADDAFKALQDFIHQNKKFDIVVIDPPSFAKQQSEIEGALKAYERLCKLGIRLVNKNGILLMASCSARIEAPVFFDLVERKIRASGLNFKQIDKTFHDIDHPIAFKEGAYLKAVYYKLGG